MNCINEWNEGLPSKDRFRLLLDSWLKRQANWSMLTNCRPQTRILRPNISSWLRFATKTVCGGRNNQDWRNSFLYFLLQYNFGYCYYSVNVVAFGLDQWFFQCGEHFKNFSGPRSTKNQFVLYFADQLSKSREPQVVHEADFGNHWYRLKWSH